MKSFVVLALAGAIIAQDVGSLPPCGQICISNMLNIANTQFGCKPGDVVCYCTNADFGNGVRDCSTESCPSQADAAKVIAFGSAYCGDALASAGTTGGALPILTSALATLTNTDAPAPTATGTDPAGDASSALSSINSAAASLSESLASVASSLSASLASQASSIRASASNAASSALASNSAALSSVASQAASAASSLATGATQTGGAVPMMTGLPLAGAAGMAAWLLL